MRGSSTEGLRRPATTAVVATRLAESHYAALAINVQIPLVILRDTVAQFPTCTEGYLKALERLDDR